ncbi:MAG TPA: site-specific integrase [Myxococcota bacterium]|nr:site-specific integrase [Myxococcota bacterium]
MSSPRQILASLWDANRGKRWDLVAKLGCIRYERRQDGPAYYLDFRPYGRVWSNRGLRLRDEASATDLLEKIRRRVAEGCALEEVIASYASDDAGTNLIPWWLERWLEVKRREAGAGDRSPSYLRELERYARVGGHFSFWRERSIHEVRYAALEDFSHWLADRGLSAKSRWNVLAAFHSFLGWLFKREAIAEMPRSYPWPKLAEYEPTVLSLETQDAILEAIPEERRGLFLALARMGLRPSEAVALEASDVQDGWLHVTKALKGRCADAPVRAPKNNRGKRLPLDPELAAWIEWHVPRERRLCGGLLFENPGAYNRNGRWTPTSMRRTWEAACAAVGLETPISIYEGCKHTFATAAKARGVEDRLLQRFLGHKDRRSVERYARLADTALLAVLRPQKADTRGRRFVGGLSVVKTSRKKPFNLNGLEVEAAGIEPGVRRRNCLKFQDFML